MMNEGSARMLVVASVTALLGAVATPVQSARPHVVTLRDVENTYPIDQRLAVGTRILSQDIKPGMSLVVARRALHMHGLHCGDVDGRAMLTCSYATIDAPVNYLKKVKWTVDMRVDKDVIEQPEITRSIVANW